MCLFDDSFVLKLCCCILKKSHLSNKGKDDDATACSNHHLISWISLALAAIRFPPEELWGLALLVVALENGCIGLIEYTGTLWFPESWCIMRHWLTNGAHYMLTASKALTVTFFSLHLNVLALRYSHKVLTVPLFHCTAPFRRNETRIRISFTSPKTCVLSEVLQRIWTLISWEWAARKLRDLLMEYQYCKACRLKIQDIHSNSPVGLLHFLLKPHYILVIWITIIF